MRIPLIYFATCWMTACADLHSPRWQTISLDIVSSPSIEKTNLRLSRFNNAFRTGAVRIPPQSARKCGRDTIVKILNISASWQVHRHAFLPRYSNGISTASVLSCMTNHGHQLVSGTRLGRISIWSTLTLAGRPAR